MCECLPTSMYVPHMPAWCLQRAGEDVRSSGIGVINSCELLCKW